MNTTTTAPDPGYYIPTPADCEEAGMIGIFNGDDERFYWPPLSEVDDNLFEGNGDFIVFEAGCATLCSDNDRELVFGDRDKCMAFLRNHIVTAAEPASDQIPDGYEVVPLVDKDGKFYKHIVIPIIDREAYPQFKGKITMSASLEEMDEASAANARQMWDKSAPAHEDGGLIRTFAPAYIPTIKDCYDAGLRRVKGTPTYAPGDQIPYPQWAVQFDENGKNPFMRGGPKDGEPLAFTSHDACILFLQSYGRAD